MSFDPSRAAGLDRLEAFLPRAGRRYASDRNHDHGRGQHRNVSGLAPYLRHRLITEQEVAAAVLSHHTPAQAEKFLQEVFWRSYWKGWLEQRPAVWQRYQDTLASQLHAQGDDRGLEQRIVDAMDGRTGIDAFDSWAQELNESGYVHNHARMWMASIWIFTLQLPWEQGADWFLRSLADGDPASNTLSWRWVAGLHTQGKRYLATRENIERFAARFRGSSGLERLAADATPLDEDYETPPSTLDLPRLATTAAGDRVGLLLTGEDLCLDCPLTPEAVACLEAQPRSPVPSSPVAEAFTLGAQRDALKRAAQTAATQREPLPATAVLSWARNAGLTRILVPYCPVGPTTAAVTLLKAQFAETGTTRLEFFVRAWDRATWPHARAGFFKLKRKIPEILADLKLTTKTEAAP